MESHSKKIFPESEAAPIQIGNGEAQLKFADCLHFLDTKGKQIYGQHFRIHPEDYEILYKLLIYFAKDEIQAQKWGINLRKGILLSGPVGCGKTSLMKLFTFFLLENKRYVMKPCRDISFEFIQEGFEIISKYSKQSFKKGEPKIFCFDDLGTESNLKYYGNETSVMAEILLSRYELFVSHKMLTHITTNLSATEIETYYGNRVRSRMREMFNLLSFEKDCGDKRK